MLVELAWPIAFLGGALGGIRAWVAVAEGRRLERMEAQDRNTRFLAGEREVDDRVKLLQAYAGVRSRPTSLARELGDLIDAACSGHTPGCDYCSCGFSKEAKAMRELPPMLAQRVEEIERRLKWKLLEEGWQQPDDQRLDSLMEGAG